MELKEGMYVRYRHLSNTKIAKIFRIDESDEDVFVALDNDDGTLESFIINASDNIIDLIEVGDYVNGKEVLNISEFKDGSRYIEFDEGRYLCKNYQIESIVTKEMFDSVKYEVK
mgnify:CR=1 FL=1